MDDSLEVQFSWRCKLTPALVPLYNAIHREKSSSAYTHMISKAIMNHQHSWWMLDIFSRQNYVNPILHYLTMLDLLKVIAPRYKKVHVRYDFKPLKYLIVDRLAEYNPNLVLSFTLQRSKARKFNYFIATGYFLYQTVLMFLVKSVIRTVPKIDGQTLLSESYVIPGYEFKDRYMTGVKSYIAKKVSLVTVPFFSSYGPVQLMVFLLLRRKKIEASRWLFKQHHISVVDWFSLYTKTLSLRHFSLPTMRHHDVDVSDLLRTWHCEYFSFFSHFESVKTVAFFDALKSHDINLRYTLCWFENQIASKVWNACANRHSHDLKSYGMMGFNPEPYMVNTYPSSAEQRLKLLPKTILCISQAAKESFFKRIENHDIRIFPALRFSYLYDQCNDTPGNTMVFFGDIDRLNTINTLTLILQVIDSLNLENWPQLYAKIHPTHRIDQIKKLIPSSLHQHVQWCDQNSDELLANALLVLGSGTSLCIESIAYGVPTIVVGNPCGLWLDPLHGQPLVNGYHFVKNAEELYHEISMILANYSKISSDLRKNRREILEHYFHPPKKQEHFFEQSEAIAC